MKRLTVLVGVCLVLSCASTASAQVDGTLAVGLNVSLKDGMDSGSIGNTNLGLLWRIGHGSDGWGWHWGLGWYGLDLDQPAGSDRTRFGELHIRPFMAGYGYTRRFGRTSATAKVLGGYAVNSFELQPSFDDAYRRNLGAQGLRADVSNSFVVKPEVSAWIDLNRKVGLNISVGYMVARPDVTVSSTLGSDRRRIDADAFMLKVGAVYSVF